MNNNQKQLTGKVALVTGGSRGIGAAIAKQLADEGADIRCRTHLAPCTADAGQPIRPDSTGLD